VGKKFPPLNDYSRSMSCWCSQDRPFRPSLSFAAISFSFQLSAMERKEWTQKKKKSLLLNTRRDNFFINSIFIFCNFVGSDWDLFEGNVEKQKDFSEIQTAKLIQTNESYFSKYCSHYIIFNEVQRKLPLPLTNKHKELSKTKTFNSIINA
jgi:hypothetical protein